MATYPTVPRGTTFRRPIVIPESLDELRGPASGLMEIPISVMWASQQLYVLDAGDDEACADVYSEALGTATLEELRMIINKNTLLRVWPKMTGDRMTRTMWEGRFSELRGECESRLSV